MTQISLGYNPTNADARDVEQLMGDLAQIIAVVNGSLDTGNLKAGAGILGTQLAANAGILGTQLASNAGVLLSQLGASGASSGQVPVWNGSSWVPGTGSGFAAIAETTLGVATASITFSSIPATYSHLVCVVAGRMDSAGVSVDDMLARFNADTGANYDRTLWQADGTTTTQQSATGTTALKPFALPGPLAPSPGFGGGVFFIPGYAGTVGQKFIIAIGGNKGGNATNNINATLGIGFWRSTTAISTLTLLSSAAGNFVAGTKATLYGMAP